MTAKSADDNTNIKAAEKIFEEHGDFVYNVIRFKTTNKNLVDDLFQELFLSIAAKPPIQLEGPKLKAYLYRAVVNDIYDAARKVKRYKNLLEKYFGNNKFCVKNDYLKDAHIAEGMVEAIIKKAWSKLSPKETNAISLRYLEANSITEVANIMKVKPASVSRYISVGLKKIRESQNSLTGEIT